MSNIKSLTYFAPGKLMIAGDWSVLENNNSALVIAVNQGVHISVSESDSFVLNAPDIGVYDYGFEIRKSLFYSDNSREDLLFFISSLNAFIHYTKQEMNDPLSISISSNISSKTHSLGKLGFGSSAALVVCLIAILSEYFKAHFTKEDIFKISYYAHYKAQGNKGSGFDIAASTYGGLIHYSKPDISLIPKAGDFWNIKEEWPGLVSEKLNPGNIDIVVAYSGVGASTVELMNTVDVFRNNNGDYFNTVMDNLNKHTLKVINFVNQGDCRGVQQYIKKIRILFSELQEKSSIFFETEAITQFCDGAESVGGVAKFSGAGGGDSVICIVCDDVQKKQVLGVWKGMGAQVIDIDIDTMGVRRS